MNDKKAATILISLLDKHLLSKEEKEAVRTAVGVLSWSSLYQRNMKSHIKTLKSMKDKRSKID